MKVLVVAGASGGHIFPAVALIEALREGDPGTECLLVLPEKRVACRLDGIRTEYLGIRNLRMRPASQLVRSFLNLSRGSLRALKILVRFKPDVVVGFGTVSSIPVLFFAWLLRAKTMLHEQNVVPGKANRLLGKFVDRVAVSFPGSARHFPKRTTVVTGNPLRKAIRKMEKAQARRELGLEPGVFTLLITGGSQGSAAVNRSVFAALRQPSGGPLQAVHITGEQQKDEASRAYEGSPVSVRIFPFLERMELAYSAADAVICRAGATTCAELMYYGLPALLVPYPFAYAHQAANAAVLADGGRATVCRDSELDAQAITDFIARCRELPVRPSVPAGAGEETAARKLARLCREVRG